MLKKILSCLISLSILGNFVLHDVSHAQANLSTHEVHLEHSHHPLHNPIIDGHHDLPSEMDHLHLEDLFQRPSTQKDPKSKLFPLLSLIPKSLLELTGNNFLQSVGFRQQAFCFDPFVFINLPLRV